MELKLIFKIALQLMLLIITFANNSPKLKQLSLSQELSS